MHTANSQSKSQSHDPIRVHLRNLRMVHLRNLWLVLVLILPSTLMAADLPKPTGSTIVSPDAQIELLHTRQVEVEGGLTEGPAVAPDGSIYFSDILRGTNKGMILRFDPKARKTTVFANDSGKSNGLIFDSQGRLVGAQGADYGGRQIVRWDVETGKRTVLADRYQGKKFNSPNDLCLDDQGRVYFSDPRYIGHEPRELEHRAVYRINKDGSVVEVTHNISKPNGLAISPDGKTLYVSEHDNGTDNNDDPEAKPGPRTMRIYAFPLGPDGLPSGPRKTLVDFGEVAGCDGMTVDEHGNLYLAVRNPKRPGVMVVNPEGKEIGFIPTGPPDQEEVSAPVGLPSNVEFGINDEANMLYITAGVSLYRIPLKVKGYHRQYR